MVLFDKAIVKLL